MGTELPWRYVPDGATVMGKDGYEWRVLSVGPKDPGTPAGSVKVVMEREGRGQITGHPPAGTRIEVLTLPPGAAVTSVERTAVDVLRDALGAEVLSCAWCQGDPGAECVCDVNCGAKGCVNF